MFSSIIVVWLVLLVLALTVVAFVTRMIEKYKLACRLSKSLQGATPIVQRSQAPILKHQQVQPTHR
jgi:hypothetical protein